MRIGAPLRISYFRVGVALLAISLVVSFIARRAIEAILVEAMCSHMRIDGIAIRDLVLKFEIPIWGLRVAGIAFLVGSSGVWLKRLRGRPTQH